MKLCNLDRQGFSKLTNNCHSLITITSRTISKHWLFAWNYIGASRKCNRLKFPLHGLRESARTNCRYCTTV